MDIYVGNISYDTTEASLSKAFEPHGTVVTARIVTDKLSGRSRGFGFVKMADAQEAAHAIEAVNGSELDGMVLTVNEARPREERPARDFQREGRGGFDRGRNGPQRSGGFGNNRGGYGHNRNSGGFGHRSKGF